ncbi:MAG: CRISPR-associated protein Cas4 [Syntrophorhabdaceae bacterium]|nr:CRISPR-associated protein Cas4 [Syntrophorhabdaceae bacterium]
MPDRLLKTTGLRVNYLYICHRKLWLFDRGITMEQESDWVLQGKLLGQHSYSSIPEEHKEVAIDNLINIDIVDSDHIGEVKYSNRMPEADRIQLLYYLYYLKKLGIEKKGTINYPKQRRKEEVPLTEEGEREVELALRKVAEILALPKPPSLERKRICPKCAYYEFCFGGED